MSEIRPELFYTKEHEWIKKTNNPKVFQMGITDFAQSALGDVTYLELPELDSTISQNDVVGSIESVKSVSELFAPLSGKVTARNESLLDDPSPLNSSPYDDAWLLEIEITNESELSQLLGPEAYASVAQ